MGLGLQVQLLTSELDWSRFFFTSALDDNLSYPFVLRVNPPVNTKHELIERYDLLSF